MQVFLSSAQVKNLKGPRVVTIGNFDGLHLGHQSLINRVREKASQAGLPSVVMTFNPHPTQVLFPEKGLKNIFDLDDRKEVLSRLGVDALVIEPFSRELSQLTPEEFFDRLLIKNLNAKSLVVGHDFSFGKNRAGTLEKLQEICGNRGVDLEIMPPVKIGDTVVSSTQVRGAVQAGQMDRAAKFLGRPFYLKGIVEKGQGRGRKIGFPTANLFTQAELLPKNGVYVTVASIRGRNYKSVTNVGKNPTFEEKTRRPIQIETHILGFDSDIYGEAVKVAFLDFLRDEMKFGSVQELTAQISRDVQKAEGYPWQNLSD